MKVATLSFIVLFFVWILPSCQGYGDHKGKSHHKKKEVAVTESSNEARNSPDTIPTSKCDTSLWRRVYNPERLQVIEYCETVTGVIEESNADDDGDQHMLLKLDKGQKDLLTKKNKSKKQGDLVIEAVCANKVKLKKVGTTCNGYINQIQLPQVGAHVRVSGSLVNDTHNGWNEIHPITKIEVISGSEK